MYNNVILQVEGVSVYAPIRYLSTIVQRADEISMNFKSC